MSNRFLLVKLFHIFFVGLLFLYVGIKGNNISKWMYKLLLFLGIVVILYHLPKLYLHLIHKEKIWVSLIHIFAVGPLLIYIGINGINTGQEYYNLLLMLGFATIGYHAYGLFINYK
jgi:hypothetical protein